MSSTCWNFSNCCQERYLPLETRGGRRGSRARLGWPPGLTPALKPGPLAALRPLPHQGTGAVPILRVAVRVQGVHTGKEEVTSVTRALGGGARVTPHSRGRWAAGGGNSSGAHQAVPAPVGSLNLSVGVSWASTVAAAPGRVSRCGPARPPPRKPHSWAVILPRVWVRAPATVQPCRAPACPRSC